LKVLVLGKTGQLARELERSQWPQAWDVAFAARDSIDLAQPDLAAKAVLERTPDLVINAAAYTAVDKAESEPELARAVNGLAPGAIAAVCADLGVPFVTVSTDYVFDGWKNGPYTEEDAIAPASVYGRSKAEGEERIRSAQPWHAILRTSWVFSPFGSNFVRTMLRLGVDRPLLRVVADQHGRPTAAGDLAKAVIVATGALVRDRAVSGTYHVANAEPTTWHSFATAIFAGAKRRGAHVPDNVEQIGTADYPTPARRPPNSELNSTKFEQTFSMPMRSWRPALDEVLDTLLSPGAAEGA
jgi:dTDP-4-dehydrorhamnose reductase